MMFDVWYSPREMMWRPRDAPEWTGWAACRARGTRERGLSHATDIAELKEEWRPLGDERDRGALSVQEDGGALALAGGRS